MLDHGARTNQVAASIAILWRYCPRAADGNLRALRARAAESGYALAPVGGRFLLIDDATHLPAFNGDRLGFTADEARAFLEVGA